MTEESLRESILYQSSQDHDHEDGGIGRLDNTAASDLLEQQQAMEQARLLTRFRELRQWQLQQQEQLMHQQKTQLEGLRQEQLKVQSLLHREREVQWGGGKVIRQQGNTPTKTPPRRRPPLPANNELMTALMSVVGSQDPLAVTLDQSVSQSQTSLPMPVLYGPPAPMLDDTSTNPELFSNPESRPDYQRDIDAVDDGVCPMPDNISEISDGSYMPHGQKKNFIRTQPFLGDLASDTASVRSDGSYIPPKQFMSRNGSAMPMQMPVSPEAASLLQTLLQTTKADTLKQMLGLVPPERVVIPDQPQGMRSRVADNDQDMDVNRNCSRVQRSQDYVDDEEQHHKYDRLHNGSRHHLEKPRDDSSVSGRHRRSAEYRHTSQGERDFGQIQPDMERLLRDAQVQGHWNQRNGQQLDDTVEDDSLMEQEVADITVQEVQEMKVLGIDDRPIKSELAGKKTFDQLLEEQMKEEEERLRAGACDSPSTRKKPFLRKGQGLARFGPGKKKAAPRKPATTEKLLDNKPSANTESKPVSRVVKVNKAAPKPKKSSAVSSHKVSKEPQSSQTNGPKKEPSPKQKNKTTARISPRQTAPKHSTAPHTDSPPNVKRVGQADSPGTKGVGRTEEAVQFDDDASFVGKIRKIEENKKVEEDELEVFELLEDFADNVSFCSNSSVVSRLLQKGREEHQANLKNVKAVIEAKKNEKGKLPGHATNSRSGKPRLPAHPEMSPRDTSLIDGVDLDTSSDTLTDSSSSESSDEEYEKVKVTPTKKSDVNQSYEALFDQSQKEGFVFVNNKNSDSDAFRSSDSEIRTSVPLSPTKSLTRKIAVKDARLGDSSEMQSILERLAAGAEGVARGTDVHAGVMTDPCSSQDQVMVNQMFGGDSVGGVPHTRSSSSSEDGMDEDDSDDSITRVKGQKSHDPEVKDTSSLFDDEDEWAVSAPQTQMAMLDAESASLDADKSTPPTSRLVARLFPKLKNANQVKQAEKHQQEQQKLQAVAKATLGDGVQSKILRDKLTEMDKEIEKFRNENAGLEKLRRDREELLGKLRQEICDFEKEKDLEVKRLEEFRAQEVKKLKHERKLFEQYQKTVRSMPDKREREEIDALKRQLSELQDEMKKKEGRWTSASNRLRQRLEVVEMENQELKEEVKLLEKRRLEMLQRETQKKNGVQKSFPRCSTPTEDKERDVVSAVISSQDPVARSALPPHHPLLNGSQHSQSTLRPDHTHGHNVSGDAIPRSQPSAPLSLPRSSSQSPDDDTSSVGAVVNLPRKQISKFSSEDPAIDKGDREYEETQYPDGKVERTYSNGAREILFANGTRKEISSDGQSIIVSFFNGDIKQIFPDQRVVYFYADAQTTHTTYPDGLEILQFQNNQIEKHYPDGTKEITFPDQTIKYLFPNGSEESIFPDGTVIRVEKSGDKTMEFPNGQREIHTETYKRREYPDGTVKTVYPDGRQETRYSTGRIRLKDKDGNVIMDRMC
ncbi:centromere protein J-like isoform X1 [Haliotis rufescens]|uniref:centromere protein J-like isoform X1 n=1 Tax=Haliotis rufescens TaxID=6454 RepID=UPI00201E8347|nr:centromere protein J-like isoform X1 [Haliotis rufescens]XP_046363652.2 centromere protein J-like isoform X1 [Haliotis rufescens]